MQLEGQVLHLDSAGEILKCEPSNEILNLSYRALLPIVLFIKPLYKVAHRVLKQRPRRRQQRWQKTICLDWKNNNFARPSRFFVHFFAVSARLRREN